LADGAPQCQRMISSDGITTRNFTIGMLSGVFEGVSLDADLSLQKIPPLGKTMGIAKNLDEYQLRICLIVPSFSDTDPSELNLQKFRLAIIASFAVLVTTLKSRNAKIGLESWNFFATKLLLKASEFVSKSGTDTMAGATIDARDGYLEEIFKCFHVPVTDMRIAIKNLYFSGSIMPSSRRAYDKRIII
jgi:hypothetical protein